jgi:8-hydroxy-5-deazaflavin:NADPH oxidoreductase
VAIPIAGDDANAKQTVTDLIEQIGFTAVDAATLAESGRQEPGTQLYVAFAESRRRQTMLTAPRVRELVGAS